MAKIKRSMATHGSLAPKAWATLAAVPDTCFFHEGHGKWHPRSAFKNSFQSITVQWEKVLARLAKIQIAYATDIDAATYDELLLDYKELLHRLYQHQDASTTVLRGLCDPNLAKPIKLDSQWFTKAKVAGALKYLDYGAEYRGKLLGALVNAMKHNQGTLHSIYFYSPSDLRLGYYLRDVLPGGVLGASAELHSGGRTAFSFARDMMVHFWWLYRLGEHLSDAIERIVHESSGITLAVQSTSFDDSHLVPVLKGLSQMPPRFFPDEALKPYPRISLREDASSVTLEFPTPGPKRFPSDMRIKTTMFVDKEHSTNKMPYFGAEYEQWIRKAF